MSPILSGSSAQKCIKLGDALKMQASPSCRSCFRYHIVDTDHMMRQQTKSLTLMKQMLDGGN